MGRTAAWLWITIGALALVSWGCKGNMNVQDDDTVDDDDATGDDDATDDDDEVEAEVDCGIDGIDPPPMVSGFWHSVPDQNPSTVDVSIWGPYQHYAFQEQLSGEQHTITFSAILTTFDDACENWTAWQMALNEAYATALHDPEQAVADAETAHQTYLPDDFWIVIFGFSAPDWDSVIGEYVILQSSMSYFVHVDGFPDLEGLVIDFDQPQVQQTWWAEVGVNEVLELDAADMLTGVGDTSMTPFDPSAQGSGELGYTYTLPRCEAFDDWLEDLFG